METLRSLMMIVALTRPESTDMYSQRKGPLRRAFEDMNHMWKRMEQMEEELRQMHQRMSQTDRDRGLWPRQEIAEEKYGASSCENCFVSYKTYSTERAPCSYCNLAYREDWNRAVLMTVESEALAMERYGALNCTACNTFYSSQSPLVCSECHPQYIEDCRKEHEEDYYESLERRYAPIY